MPVKIETTITYERQSPYDRRKPVSHVVIKSDDQDAYLANSIVSYGRGRMKLEMRPSDEGQVVRETMVFLGDELDEAGNLVEHETIREQVFRNVGDSFTSTMRSASIANRDVDTRKITFTKVEKARIGLQNTETPAA